MGIYALSSDFIQRVLGICNFAWHSPYGDHTRERQQSRGPSAPLEFQTDTPSTKFNPF